MLVSEQFLFWLYLQNWAGSALWKFLYLKMALMSFIRAQNSCERHMITKTTGKPNLSWPEFLLCKKIALQMYQQLLILLWQNCTTLDIRALFYTTQPYRLSDPLFNIHYSFCTAHYRMKKRGWTWQPCFQGRQWGNLERVPIHWKLLTRLKTLLHVWLYKLKQLTQG